MLGYKTLAVGQIDMAQVMYIHLMHFLIPSSVFIHQRIIITYAFGESVFAVIPVKSF